MFENIRADWGRWAEGAPRTHVPRTLLTQGFWASCEYRFGHWARNGAPAWARLPLMVVSVFTHLLIEILTGISIQPAAKIGPGLQVGHFGGIFVNGGATIGPGCTLGHDVTIGQDVTPPFGIPVIGRGVYIAPGAKIFGEITIGDNVAIGANAVVRDSIPDRAIAVGIPARVVRIQEPKEVRAAKAAQ
jgi:serine O-acetyltransferase